MTGHEMGLLKGYMQDLVEQARQESFTFRTAGYKEQPYTPDQALMDLLAILDDRMESEGAQVGLTETFRYRMGLFCNGSIDRVQESAWLEAHQTDDRLTKAEIRSVAYRALIEFIETQED